MKTKLIKKSSGMEVRIWEGEEPKHEDYGSTLNFEMDYKSWLSSYKSYPVRSEDETDFRELAYKSFSKGINKNEAIRTFNTILSQGIEIPSERVKIDSETKYYKNKPAGEKFQIIKYATLLSEDKEGEGHGDAVEFADWISDNDFVMMKDRFWLQTGKEMEPATTKELYKLFKQ